jgi:[acyl-carrier-protein] S-malonyltransferase
MHTAFFPGQGSQEVGMARDLYDGYAQARQRFEEAADVLGYALKDVCFDGPADELVQTSRAQPAIFVHSLILWELWGDARPDFSFAAGHSLGEFSALTAAGAFEFATGLKLVGIRSKAMQKACDDHPGTMAAVTHLPQDKIEDLVAAGSEAGTVVPANYNAEKQVVFSGETKAVEKIVSVAKDFGARRALVLNVGGAFHSPLMEDARQELAQALDDAVVSAPVIPVVLNVTAMPTQSPDEIRTRLKEQLVSPVRWWQTLQYLGEAGLTHATEIGPGQVIQGLVKQTLPHVQRDTMVTREDLVRATAGAEAV